MRKVHVIGIGAGDPRHMTVQAIEALNALDVLFLLDKGEAKADLIRLRETICDRFLTNPRCRRVTAPSPPRDGDGDYRAGVADWHAARAEIYEGLIRHELGAGETGGFLVWGDPALYDSTLRILDTVRTRLEIETLVVPGISAAQALAAAHRIPLNRIGAPVHLTTARAVRDALGLAEDSVVFLDSGETLAMLPAEGLHIWWGAYLGTGDEVLIAGRFAEVRDEILRLRAERRAAKGWIMDIYLLRKMP